MPKKLQAAGPDVVTVSRATTHPRSMAPGELFANLRAASAAAVAADQALDAASLAGVRRNAPGPSGKLGDNPLAHRLAGRR